MQRTAILSAVCGVALAAQPKSHASTHFMALAQVKATCDPSAYTGPSYDEYKKMCSDLDAACKSANDDLAAKHNALLAELKAECERQKGILAGKEDTHAEEKSDVKEETMDVAEARKTVAEFAHCRPELVDAKEALFKEEAISNDSPADIDRECKAKKLVMEKEQCVEKLEAAEAVLAKQKEQHQEESHEEDQAAAALPPQEEKVRIVCAKYSDLNSKGVPEADCGNNQAKKDALLAQADQFIEDLLAEYLRQKKILEGKEGVHADEKADVDAQEKVVSSERKDVTQARSDVKEYAHCPPELEKAQAELSRQEAIPNDTPTDIDAECEAKKAVMEAEKCVEKLRKAEAILGTQKEQHSAEKSDLSAEASEEDRAAAALPPQEKIVCDLKAALDAARAARKALPCGSGSEDNSEPAPAPAPEPEKEEPKEKKSGATRASVAVAAVAALFCALVQA